MKDWGLIGGTYFRPQAKVSRLEINPRKVRNRHTRPNIRHIVRSPNNTTVHNRNRMNLSSPSPMRKLLVNSPNGKHNNHTERETDENLGIKTVLAENLAGSDSTPED